MKTLSIDLRKRILSSYDKNDVTRQDVADRYCVSLGMVKKLIQQRRKTGNINPRHHYSGRKPIIIDKHRKQLKDLIKDQPDMTLKELRDSLKLDCSIQAIHYVLVDMGLTYKKRRFGQANKIERI
jgi:transposase